jgi:hypothetical protein
MKPNFNLTMQDHGGTITILVYQNSHLAAETHEILLNFLPETS